MIYINVFVYSDLSINYLRIKILLMNNLWLYIWVKHNIYMYIVSKWKKKSFWNYKMLYLITVLMTIVTLVMKKPPVLYMYMCLKIKTTVQFYWIKRWLWYKISLAAILCRNILSMIFTRVQTPWEDFSVQTCYIVYN